MGKSSLMIRTAERLAERRRAAGHHRPHRVRRPDDGRAVVQGLPVRRAGSARAAHRPRRSGGTRSPITRSRTGSRATCAKWRWSSAPSGSWSSSTRSTRRCASTSPTTSSPRSASSISTAPPTRCLQRLSFVLIGVATPGDLIKDAARTPFNIGHGIELTDFTLDEAVARWRPSAPCPITPGAI